jgi:hypothetical protein
MHNNNGRAIPRQLEAGFSLQNLGFNPRCLHMRFVVYEMALELLFFKVSLVSLCCSYDLYGA